MLLKSVRSKNLDLILSRILLRAFKGTQAFRTWIQIRNNRKQNDCYRSLVYIVAFFPLLFLLVTFAHSGSTKSMPILFVNMDKEVESRLRMEKILRGPNVWEDSEIIRIPAVNGRAESLSKLATFGILSKVASESLNTVRVVNGEWLSRGGLGCYMSHVRVWRRVVQLNRPAIVLEDDVQLFPSFKSRIQKALAELPHDWGMLYLANLVPRDIVKKSEHEYGKHIVRLSGNYWGTYAYAISPSAAHILLLHALPLQYQVDSFIQKTTQFWGVKVFRLKKNVVTTDNGFERQSFVQVKSKGVDTVPPKIFILCSNHMTDTDECEEEVLSQGNLVGLGKRNVAESIVKKRLGYEPVEDIVKKRKWETVFVNLSNASSALRQEIGEEAANKDWSYFAKVHILCLAILKQNGGGICASHETQLLRPFQPLLLDSETVVGSTWTSEISPTLVAASPNSFSVIHMLSKLMNLKTTGDSKEILALWQEKETKYSNVRVLPPTMIDPLPMVSSALHVIPQFDDLSLAVWQPSLSEKIRRIPRILHFVWLSDTISVVKLRTILTWTKMHPDWQIRLWTEKHLNRLSSAQKIFSSNDLRQRADIARYEIIWKYGGVYVDTDFECLKPLDTLLYSSTGFVCHEEGRKKIHLSLSNGLFGFTSKHPVLARAMKLADEAQLNTEDVNLSTGPMMFRHAIGDELDKLLVFPKEYFYPISYADRYKVDKWKCDIQSCKSRFPKSYAIHLWKTGNRRNVGMADLEDLEQVLSEHNKKASNLFGNK